MKIRNSIEGASHSMIYVSPVLMWPHLGARNFLCHFKWGQVYSIFFFFFFFSLSISKRKENAVSFVTRYHEFFESIDFTGNTNEQRAYIFWRHTTSSPNLLWSNIHKFYTSTSRSISFHNLSRFLWKKKETNFETKFYKQRTRVKKKRIKWKIYSLYNISIISKRTIEGNDILKPRRISISETETICTRRCFARRKRIDRKRPEANFPPRNYDIQIDD